MSDDILTRNSDGELAVRTVSSMGDNYVNKDDVYTRDENGNLCVRVTGAGGGGDQHNLGYFATQSALEEAHPTGTDGDWAIIGATDTVWVWDSDTTAWVDTDQKGQVTSVNGETGAVVLDAEDVGALPADTPIPDPQVNSDWNATSGVAEILNKPTLGTAAAADTTDFATASQGEKADTAVQPEDLATVATTGDYDDLLNKPVIPQAGVPQYTTMPTPSASNLGEVAQYSGETVPESATITQTVGSGLTNLAVALEDFVAEEQPMGDETVEFTVTVVAPHVESRVVNGYTEFQSGTIADFDNVFQTMLGETHDHFYMWCNGITWNFQPDEAAGSGSWFNMTTEQLATAGIILSGQLDPDDEIEITLFRNAIAVWEKDNETVDLVSYGITYTGTPSDGDELTVDYVKGITQGYFYLNAPTYSEPTATISQTTGSDLTDLAVDVDTFVATEQPAQSESVEFVANVVPAEASLGTQVGVFECSLNSAEYIARLVSTWGNEWWTGTGTKDLYFVYNNGWAICTDSQGSNVLSYGVANTDWGFYVTDISQIQNGDYVPVIYTDGSTTWEKDSQTVDLADYGITYSGTPVDNDVLTVVYTAPVITGYNWNQINVQPAGEGGGSAGIEWKTTIDLPADYSTGSNPGSIYTVAGGLPDGVYEFYLSVKTSSYTLSATSNGVPGIVTYKILMNINNSQNSINAQLGYIIDGNYMNNSTYYVRVNSWSSSDMFYKNGQDFIFFPVYTQFVSDLINRGVLIPECFRLSAIKNVDTGDEYIATGVLYDGTNFPSYTSQYNGMLYADNLVDIPSIPSHQYTWYKWTYNDNNQYLKIHPQYSISVPGFGTEISEVDISISNSEGFWHGIVENTVYNARLRVLSASGIFANVQVGIDNESLESLIKLNTPSGTSGEFNMSIGEKGARTESIYVQFINPNGFVPLEPYAPGMTIDEYNLGDIIQYTGETNANYTKGYFYKATGTKVYVPGSATITEITSTGTTITMDVDGFLQYMTSIGYPPATTIDWMNDPFYDWAYVNGDMSWMPYGQLPNDALQFFTFTPTPSETVTWQTSNCVAGHMEIQNPAWEQIDVQPTNYATPPSADGTYVLKATVSSGVVTYSWVAE